MQPVGRQQSGEGAKQQPPPQQQQHDHKPPPPPPPQPQRWLGVPSPAPLLHLPSHPPSRRSPSPPPAAVLLSALFLGDKPTPAVLAVLVPIIGGVVLASTSELSFNWKGFLSGGLVQGPWGDGTHVAGCCWLQARALRSPACCSPCCQLTSPVCVFPCACSHGL